MTEGLQNINGIENGWQALVLIVSIVSVGLGPWLMDRAKRESDGKAGKHRRVEVDADDVKQVADLVPAVEALSIRVSTAERDLAVALAEVAELRPIARVKYPASIEFIRDFVDQNPVFDNRIPLVIRDDVRVGSSE